MARRSQRIQVTKTNTTNQNKTKKQPTIKRTYKPKKRKTQAEIDAQEFEKQKREALKSVLKLKREIENRSIKLNSQAENKLQRYRREAESIRQGGIAKQRLNNEWSDLYNKPSMFSDGFVVLKRNKPCGSWNADTQAYTSLDLETWDISFPAPSYSELDFLKATINFPGNYPFESPIIDFAKFRFPLFDVNAPIGPGSMLQTRIKDALKSFREMFENDEYFCWSNREEIVKVKWYHQTFQERFMPESKYNLSDSKYKST